MTRIEVDPDELRAFQSAIESISNELNSRRLRLHGASEEVRSFWDDAKYQTFMGKQEALLSDLFLLEKHCQYLCERLAEKAALAEAYLKG